MNDQLSLKELKQNLKETLKNSNLLNNIKSQIRKEFITTIKSDNNPKLNKLIDEQLDDNKSSKTINYNITSISTQTDQSSLTTNELIELQLKDSRKFYKNELELEYQKRFNRLIDKENEINRINEEKERNFQQSLNEARQCLQYEINELKDKELKYRANVLEIESYRNDLDRRERDINEKLQLYQLKERENKSHIQEIQRLTLTLKDNQLQFDSEKETLYKEIELLKSELAYEINKNSSLQLKLSESKGRDINNHLQEISKLTDELKENSLLWESEKKSLFHNIELLKNELSIEKTKNSTIQMKIADTNSYSYDEMKSQYQEIQRLSIENKENTLQYESDRRSYIHEIDSLKNDNSNLKEKNTNLINRCKELEKQLKLQQQIHNNLQDVFNKDIKMNTSGLIRSSLSSPSRSMNDIDHSKRISDMVNDVLTRSNIKSNAMKSSQVSLTNPTLLSNNSISSFPNMQVYDPRISIDTNNNQQYEDFYKSIHSSNYSPFINPLMSAYSPQIISKPISQTSNNVSVNNAIPVNMTDKILPQQIPLPNNQIVNQVFDTNDNDVNKSNNYNNPKILLLNQNQNNIKHVIPSRVVEPINNVISEVSNNNSIDLCIERDSLDKLPTRQLDYHMSTSNQTSYYQMKPNISNNTVRDNEISNSIDKSVKTIDKTISNNKVSNIDNKISKIIESNNFTSNNNPSACEDIIGSVTKDETVLDNITVSNNESEVIVDNVILSDNVFESSSDNHVDFDLNNKIINKNLDLDEHYQTKSLVSDNDVINIKSSNEIDDEIIKFRNEVKERNRQKQLLLDSQNKPLDNIISSYSTISMRDSTNSTSMKTEDIPILDDEDNSIEVEDDSTDDSGGWS